MKKFLLIIIQYILFISFAFANSREECQKAHERARKSPAAKECGNFRKVFSPANMNLGQFIIQKRNGTWSLGADCRTGKTLPPDLFRGQNRSEHTRSWIPCDEVTEQLRNNSGKLEPK